MNQEPHDESFQDTNLNSPEYRERLMRKLNCLIAVLEVATAKVRKSLTEPAADTERLGRIRTNLQSTLDVCMRARSALERREALPKELPENLSQVIEETKVVEGRKADRRKVRTTHQHGELRQDERRKFESMGTIQKSELVKVDLEDLTRKLQGF
ncbi:MAG: hypothetical protein IPJ19_06720 [Planctomycetes bacterium]|nr:hypothetical protein [Planctomycetota bacterium]